MPLEPHEITMLIQEEVDALIKDSDRPKRTCRVFWGDSKNPYILFPAGQELTGEELLNLAYMLAGADLAPAFDIISTKEYSRAAFRFVKRQVDEKPLPALGKKTSMDRGTSRTSPLYDTAYRKYFKERYNKKGK